MSYAIRWMLKIDMQQVLEIERASFPDPWGDDDFIRVLKTGNVIGRVIEHPDADGQVIGFSVHALQKKTIDLINIAIDPIYRGQGAGRALVDKLIEKLSKGKRTRIESLVDEHNLPAQLFFKSCGFKAVRIDRDAVDLDHDAFEFRFSIDPVDLPMRVVATHPRNRIAKYTQGGSS